MKILVLPALTAAVLMSVSVGAYADEELTPYGTATVDMHEYPEVNQVYDVNYDDPKSLKTLYAFVKNTSKVVPGDVVVVTHGPELRAFAKENYDKYYGLMDQMAELAEQGVEFRMCNNALRAAGYEPEDMHGFVTVVPAGFAEIVMLQSQGYEYINPIPLPVGGVRELEKSSE
ncbi:DsrE family protein [uncultured Paracoccus sp.]|uniref:DsrE family protein n=1 Tax=uncultured Paracoccus sp. TaxID=189685 RepID=UPI002634DB47|nr:DsrE family protein [uncultured Paracoccus sp.]